MVRTSRLPWQRSRRYGIIDIGTNSCLLLVVEAHRSSAEYVVLYDDAEVTQLGTGFYATNRLRDDAISRTMDTVRRYLTICDQEEVDEVVVTGTSVLRDAINGDALTDEVHRRFDVDVEVISGEEEARLSFLAVRRDATLPIPPQCPLIVTDIGGGSTELIIGDERIRQMASFEIGSVRLTEMFLKSDPPVADEIEALRAYLCETFHSAPSPVVDAVLAGVGGTATTLANIAAHESVPVPPVHGFRLRRETLAAEIDRFARMTVEERAQIPGLEPKRAPVILGGALIAEHVMSHYGQDEICTTVKGLRYGVLFDRYLNEDDWKPALPD